MCDQEQTIGYQADWVLHVEQVHVEAFLLVRTFQSYDFFAFAAGF